MSLQRFDQNGLELIINVNTGECFASQSAIARMVDVSETTIRKWITSNQIEIKQAEILTSTGLKTSNLLNEDAIFQAFAKYKPELLIQCAKAGIRIYLHRLAGFEVSVTLSNQLDNNTELALKMVDLIFSNVPIKPELVAGVKLNIVQKRLPALAQDIEETRQLLIGNTAQEFELLTATEIGKRIGISAIKVNQKLIELGFQVKNENKKSKKDSSYLPTTKGSEFSDLTLSTGKGNDSTSYQQLRWYSSVINQLQPQ